MLMRFISVILALLCTGVRGSEFSYDKCHNHDGMGLYQEAAAIGALADAALVPSRFARVANGFMRVIMDETDGQEDGGATNTKVMLLLLFVVLIVLHFIAVYCTVYSILLLQYLYSVH
jgi:hypothetical protein